LQKRPIILRSLLIVATPYDVHLACMCVYRMCFHMWLRNTLYFTDCTALHHTAPRCNTLQHAETHKQDVFSQVAKQSGQTTGVLQCVAVCCSTLQCSAVCCSVLQCPVVYCSVLQCVAVCCRVLQCAATC